MTGLSLLDGIICARVFKDHPEASGYAEWRHGTLEELRAWLDEQNGMGMGCYFTVNQTDGVGCSTEHITSVRAYYVDVDGIPEPEAKDFWTVELLRAPIPPSAIIESRNGLQAYWNAASGESTDKAAYTRVILGLIRRFHGDHKAKDIARVLRIPGYLHQKDPVGPFMVTPRYEDDGTVHTASELLRAYPPPPPERAQPKRAPASSAPKSEGVPAPDFLVERYVKRAAEGSRNATGFDLACQLRDNGYEFSTARDALLDYQQRVSNGSHPYTPREAMQSLHSAYKAPRRTAWNDE